MVLCFEKYANVNKNALKKHAVAHSCDEQGREGTTEEKTVKTNKGRAVGLRHRLPEIMKHMKARTAIFTS